MFTVSEQIFLVLTFWSHAHDHDSEFVWIWILLAKGSCVSLSVTKVSMIVNLYEYEFYWPRDIMYRSVILNFHDGEFVWIWILLVKGYCVSLSDIKFPWWWIYMNMNFIGWWTLCVIQWYLVKALNMHHPVVLFRGNGYEARQTSKKQTKMPRFMLQGPWPFTIFCFAQQRKPSGVITISLY